MYYNFQKQIKDLYEIMGAVDKKYHQTLRLMIDECVFHYLEMNKVPFESQGVFLATMFPDCPTVVSEYKLKRFE